jgi:alkanesulfonate monooxygenase
MLPAQITGAMGASTALVGSYETVAAAILDYVDLGADLVSIRGYDNLNDAIDYGRYVLPLVRSELAHRASTGQRQPLQPAQSAQSGQPAQIGQPGQPSQPGQPGQLALAGQPARPAQPAAGRAS